MNPSAPKNLEILRTPRLILTRMQAGHIPELVELWTGPDVTRYMGGPREPASLAAGLAETARDPWKDKFDLWPLLEKATGKVVGHCGLLDKEIEGTLEIELVYVLAASAWGKGYATEIAEALRTYAFSALGLKRLVSLIDPDNHSSARVAAKIGMHREREIVRSGGAVRLLYAVERGA